MNTMIQWQLKNVTNKAFNAESELVLYDFYYYFGNNNICLIIKQCFGFYYFD